MTTHRDPGLWVEGISPQAEDSIRREVSLYRAKHGLADSSCFIRVLGTTYGQMRVRVGKGGDHYGDECVINDTLDAGVKVTEIWETLRLRL